MLPVFLVLVYASLADRQFTSTLNTTFSLNRVTVFFSTLLISLFALAQVNGVASTDYIQKRNSEIMRLLDYPNTDGITFRSLIDNCYDVESATYAAGEKVFRENGMIWSNEGQILHYLLGVPSITLAHRYGEDAIDFDAFSKDNEIYNVRMLAMIPGWSYDSQWKVDSIVEWAKDEQMPMLEISGYGEDINSTSTLVFVDPACAP